MKRVFILYTDSPIVFSSKTKLYNHLFENYAKNFFPGTNYIQLISNEGVFINIRNKSSFNNFLRENIDGFIYVVLPLLKLDENLPIIYTRIIK